MYFVRYYFRSEAFNGQIRAKNFILRKIALSGAYLLSCIYFQKSCSFNYLIVLITYAYVNLYIIAFNIHRCA